MSNKLWANNPKIQDQYERILSEQQRLQKLLGLESKTLEQRWENYLQRQQQKINLEKQQQQQFDILQSIKKPLLPLPRSSKSHK